MIVVDLISENPERNFAPYQRMATAIVEVASQAGRCSPQDLPSHGFDRQEIAALWPMAHAIAALELDVMDCNILPKLLPASFLYSRASPNDE